MVHFAGGYRLSALGAGILMANLIPKLITTRLIADSIGCIVNLSPSLKWRMSK